MKKNILVFPCGSEVALEIYNSVKYSRHFHLIGASSISDHGEFIFEDYIGNLPFVGDEKLISSLFEIVKKRKIVAIFPAMDSAIAYLKEYENQLGCPVISSPLDTVRICLSKQRTYKKLSGIIKLPTIYSPDNTIKQFPVFGKPDTGYGAKGTAIIENMTALKMYQKKHSDSLILEFLPGKEYTVDCFSDKDGRLLYAESRERQRIKAGISVRTSSVNKQNEFYEIANKINNAMDFKGAWFYQVKRDQNNKLTLLEVASRLGGSSSLCRVKGINFALLSIFVALDQDVVLSTNTYDIIYDRSLSSSYKINLSYKRVYIDYDDCLILDKKKVNTELISYIFECRNNGIEVVLLTKHSGNLEKNMEKFGLNSIFNKIIKIDKNQSKSDYIEGNNAIFIDDSFQERHEVKMKHNIETFSPDMVCALMNNCY